jgi:hypothetical protein
MTSPPSFAGEFLPPPEPRVAGEDEVTMRPGVVDRQFA